MDSDWNFDDCRLENNGVIRKGCGYNREFRYNVPLGCDGVNMGKVMWCNHNCEGAFGWWFKDHRPTRKCPIRHEVVMSFRKKIDCFNFKLKIM